ncbi:MAG: sugar ABC transporter substrate-binding protein [Clostridia bacterium]|nr:sugar ABC transporter substrate-binding protein [Clostridia bacterium]
MKRFACIFLALVFIMTLAACGGQQNQNSTPTVKQTTNEFGWMIPDVTTKFTMYVGKDNPDKHANRAKAVLPWVKEKFNVEIDSVVYDVDVEQKISLMLAASDYPEVVSSLTEEQALRFVEQKKAVNLAPLMDKHGVNIKKGLEKWKIYSTLLTEDGKLFYLPRVYGMIYEPDNTAHLRYDWYKKMGSPSCVTPDDYYNIITQMVREHPKNSKGEKVYAISGHEMATWGGESTLAGLAGIWGIKDQYKEDASHNLTHWVNTDEGLAMTKYMNRFNLDGLLDPDMFINKYDDWKQKFSNERIVGHIGPWWNSWNAGHEVWMKTMSDYNPDMRYFQIMLKAPEAERSYMTGKSARATWNQFTIITDKAKKPEAILDWLDFCNTDIGRWIPGYGRPEETPGDGALWKFVNGKPEFTEGPKNDLIKGTIDFDKQIWDRGAVFPLMVCNSTEGVRGNNTSFMYDHAFTDEMESWNKMIAATKDSIYDNTLQKMVQISPSTPLGSKHQQIKDAIISGWAKCIYSKSEAECEKNFQELRDKVNALGLKEIEKFRTDEYKKLLAKY